MNTAGDPEMRATPEGLLEAYLEAFRARDVGRCVSFFHEDATIDFQVGTYRGRKSIEEWHNERFAAGLNLDRIDRTTVSGNTVTIDATVSSSRLAAFRIKSLGARVMIQFDTEGKVKYAKMSARASNPFKLLHSE